MSGAVVQASDYDDAVENYLGWCPSCARFTRETTEPDVEDYDCPVCGGHEVHGAEQAAMLELFEIEG